RITAESQLGGLQQLLALLADQQACQQRGGSAERAIGVTRILARQSQHLLFGNQVALQLRLTGLQQNNLALQSRNASGCQWVARQCRSQAALDPGEQCPGQHQGLMPRCSATTPPVMLW